MTQVLGQLWACLLVTAAGERVADRVVRPSSGVASLILAGAAERGLHVCLAAQETARMLLLVVECGRSTSSVG